MVRERALDPHDPLRRDRDLAHLASGWRRFRRALRAGDPEAQDPFEAHRAPTTRTAFHALLDLPADDPLRLPLLRWTLRLLEQRVNVEALRAETLASTRKVPCEGPPETGELSLRDCLRRALQPGAARRHWVTRAISLAGPRQQACLLLAERRVEIDSRLASPIAPAALRSLGADVPALARSYLDETREAWCGLRVHRFDEALGHLLAEGADRGWPARLTPSTLAELTLSTSFFARFAPDVGVVPPPVSPASFLVGLVRLGRALQRAAAPRDQPFVIAQHPLGLPEHTTGAWLAGLTLSLPFLKQRLGLGAGDAANARRRLAVALLGATRALAFRVVLGHAAAGGATALQRAYDDGLQRWWELELPPAALGTLPRLDVDDAARFLGAALGAARAAALRDEHDEDWFRNPRALAEIAEQLRLPPVAEVGEESARQAVSELVAQVKPTG